MKRYHGAKLTKRDALVSFIIPARNNDDTIERCLRSACEQTYENIEILVWDDMSTDNTYEAAMSYKDDRIRVFKGERWLAPAGARNELQRRAKGQFLALMDADDMSHTHRIERQLFAMKLAGAGASICKKFPMSKMPETASWAPPESIGVSDIWAGVTIPSMVVCRKPFLGWNELMLSNHEHLWSTDVRHVFKWIVLAEKSYVYSYEPRGKRFTTADVVFKDQRWDLNVGWIYHRNTKERLSSEMAQAEKETVDALSHLEISYDGVS